MKIKHSGDCSIYVSPICDCGELRKTVSSDCKVTNKLATIWSHHIVAIADAENRREAKAKSKLPKMSTTSKRQLIKLMCYINNDCGLLGLLYDLNLLPECVKEGSEEWRQMILISLQWREAMKGRTENVANTFTAKA